MTNDQKNASDFVITTSILRPNQWQRRDVNFQNAGLRRLSPRAIVESKSLVLWIDGMGPSTLKNELTRFDIRSSRRLDGMIST